MEITLEAIISLITLLVGGGGVCGFFFWRQMKRTKEAEAKQAEAEAKLKEAEARKADIEADKERQDYYQQLAKDLAEDREDRKRQNDELRAERDHYKQERNELRDVVQKLENDVLEIRKQQTEREIETDKKIAQLGRRVEAMRPFLCGDMLCKKRQRVAVLEGEDAEPTITEKPRKKKTAVSTDPSDGPINNSDL